MQTSYSPLFKLDFQHDYFPENKCTVLNLVPTAETAKTMQSLGIQTMQREARTEFFYASEGALTQTNNPIRLSFYLRAKDPLFLHYTQLPVSSPGERIHYFTNLFATGSSATMSASEDSTLPLRPAIFTVRASQPGAAISLFDELGNELFNSSVEEADGQSLIQPTGEDGTEYRIDLSGQAPGRYQLREGDDALLDFVMLSGDHQEGNLGLFSVYIGDTGNNGQHLLTGSVVTPADYTLAFTARATRWRYYLINQTEPGFEGFQILDGVGGAVLASSPTPPDTQTLSNGTEAVVLTLQEPIRLRQRSTKRLQLSCQQKGSGPGGTPMAIQLPSADANRITPAPPSDEESELFYSELYVYL